MNLVWGVLILGFAGTIIGPLIVSAAARRALALATLLEHQRHDELARRLAQRQHEIDETAAAFVEQINVAIGHVTRQSREQAEVIAGRLETINGVVNSTLTGALEAQLAALEAQLVLMRRVVALEAEGTRSPSADLVVGIETTMAEIRLLRGRLLTRAESAAAGMDMRAALSAPVRDRPKLLP